MGDVNKIHIGAGSLVLNPDTDNIDVGFCSDGATLTYNKPLERITVDQRLGTVGFFAPNEEVAFETMLNELDATKLNIAMGGVGSVTTQVAAPGVKAYTQIEFGGDQTIKEYVLQYTAKKRTNPLLNVIIRLYYVAISPELELGFTKDGKTAFKLTALAREDDNGRIGYIREETAEAL